MPVTVIVGAQWGDEGKGKWVDYLAKDADLVCRFQGGNNAGHTIYIDGKKLVLHLLPTGVLYPEKKIALTSGVVIDPLAFWAELKEAQRFVAIDSKRLLISPMAHVITPWDIYCDCRREEGSSRPIGTTRRGIGPSYSAKSLRSGLRMHRYTDNAERRSWYEENIETTIGFREFYTSHSEQWQRFDAHAELLAPFLAPSEHYIRLAIDEGQHVICEGAQGSLLDLSHGNYPYVTSSSTLAAQAAVSIGVDPRALSNIYGVAKAYTTRVGEGPFPTELSDATGAKIANKGHEFGATTQRPRRCGWFDAVAMRYAKAINGLDGIYLSKLDILSDFSELCIAVAYEHPRLGNIDYYPPEAEILGDCKPVYEIWPGWQGELPSSGALRDMPAAAQDFVNAIAKHSTCPILGIGCGPGRSDFLSA